MVDKRKNLFNEMEASETVGLDLLDYIDKNRSWWETLTDKEKLKESNKFFNENYEKELQKISN